MQFTTASVFFSSAKFQAGGGMELAVLKKLTLDEVNLRAVLDAPPPPSPFKGTAKQLVGALDQLYAVWGSLLAQPLPISAHTYRCPKCGQEQTLDEHGVRARALFVVSVYFDTALGALLAREDKSDFPKALRMSLLRDILPKIPESEDKIPPTMAFHFVTFEYLFAMSALTIIQTMRPVLRDLASPIETLFHQTLEGLFRNFRQISDSEQRRAATRLVHSVLARTARVYQQMESKNAAHRPGAFSAIRTSELALLARRDQQVMNRYGAKAVERVFEQQLALIAQSFGMFVASTRVGRSTVDLVCIAGGDERTTFLIEAKTTTHAYSLPTKDSRALLDYIKDVRTTLGTLPPLKFVLIVGDGASSTLEGKLAQLESRALVPVRFATAQQLAHLRERIAGPVPMPAFTDAIICGSRVLSDDWIDQVVKRYDVERSAHQTFVEALLPGGRAKLLEAPTEWRNHLHK